MRSLLRVELTRLRWRRAVLLLLLGCLVVPALIAVATIWGSRPVSESEMATIRSEAASEIARCERRPRQFGVPPARAAERCPELVVSWYVGRQDLSLARERGGSGLAVTGTLTVLLMLVATTFVGHDWNTGSVSNQLLFRPRRGRLWLAKAVVVTGTALATAVVVATAYWLVLWGVMQARDLTVAEGGLRTSLLLGLRGAGIAAAAALGCYALTMLLRSTVATLGVVLAVAFASLLLLDAAGVPEPWQPLPNIAAVLQDGTEYWVEVPPSCYDGVERAPEGSLCDDTRDLPLWRGAAYHGAGLLLVGAASVLSFRRRDVP
ncbi:hypothetical protein [Nocardioides marmotae]|uniref:hypothetical protein n=1 Tax=Nocardioides marmotae TaxID=2663857 RepID=UPI0012B62BD7|nr:hypothetical protein [Nocardioides marmotae]MBC9733433.1 hypothetical protein [Nocardioides marmotae]MTB84540.1 hypothetical protein [Nocardioides marmotae]